MERIETINGKTFLFWDDMFGGGVKFHELPRGSVIPIRNENAPVFHGNMKDAIKWVKKEVQI